MIIIKENKDHIIEFRARMNASNSRHLHVPMGNSFAIIPDTANAINPILCAAALNGYIDAMELLLLEANANIEAVDAEGRSPLYCAAINGHTEIVELLLGANANIEALGPRKQTPLYCAAINGHTEIVELLLEASANIKAVDTEDRTPLHYAAINGHPEIVELLLGANANIEALGPRKQTPLHYAARNRHLEIVKLLLEANANIEAVDSNNSTPLFLAARNAHQQIVEFLLKNGADSASIFKESFASNLKKLVSIKKVIESARLVNDLTTEESIYRPISYDEIDFETFILRLKYKLGPSFKEDIGVICGGLLCSVNKLSPTPIGVLIDQQQNTDMGFDKSVTEPIQKLIKYYIELAKDIFSEEEYIIFSIDINRMFAPKSSGSEASELSASENFTDAQIAALKEAIHKINISILEKHKALDQIIHGLYPQQWLQADEKRQAEEESKNLKDVHKLCLAILKGESKTIKTILENNPDIINKQDPNSGNTPLHFACAIFKDDTVKLKALKFEVAKLLISQGADSNITNNKGKTPFDYCNSSAKLELTEAISQRDLLLATHNSEGLGAESKDMNSSYDHSRENGEENDTTIIGSAEAAPSALDA